MFSTSTESTVRLSKWAAQGVNENAGAEVILTRREQWVGFAVDREVGNRDIIGGYRNAWTAVPSNRPLLLLSSAFGAMTTSGAAFALDGQRLTDARIANGIQPVVYEHCACAVVDKVDRFLDPRIAAGLRPKHRNVQIREVAGEAAARRRCRSRRRGTA